MDATTESSLRWLCGALYTGDVTVEQITHHTLHRPMAIAPHRHPWMLQFDLILRCTGEAILDGQTVSLQRCTMMATPAGMMHGYRLIPRDREGHVYHLKLASRPKPPHEPDPTFPGLLTDQPEPPALQRAFDELVRLHEAQPTVTTLLLASITRVITLWPTGDSIATNGTQLISEAILTGSRHDERLPLGQIIEFIDQHLDQPPALGELAEMSHVSIRHFARRFKTIMGCTPLSFINARRLRAARQLLADDERTVGEVGLTLGFPSPPAFTRWFKQQTGTTPLAYRNDPTRL